LLAEKEGLQITKYINRAAEKMHRISSHLLRHSFVVWGLDSRVPIRDLKERLGHTTLIVATIHCPGHAAPHKRQLPSVRVREQTGPKESFAEDRQCLLITSPKR
jgi:integrase